MDFIGRMLWRLKWLMVLAALLGPYMAWEGYRDSSHMAQIIARGELIQAIVQNGTVTTGRYGTKSFSIDVAWADNRGPQAEHISLSDSYAQQIVQGDMLLIDTVTIRALPFDGGRQAVIVDEAAYELRSARTQMWVGLIAAIAGLIIAPLMFYGDYRAHKETKMATEGVDEMLAKMRAEKKPDAPPSP